MSRHCERPLPEALASNAISAAVSCLTRPFAALFVLAGILQVAIANAGAPTARFIPLGDLAGGEFQSFGSAVSADGKTVVGASTAQDAVEGFIWTEDSGMVSLGSVGMNGVTGAHSVSSDGKVIAGTSYVDLNSYTEADPFLFRVNDGFSELVGCGCHTWIGTVKISGDGRVLAGSRPSQLGRLNAYLWTAETGPVDLGGLPGGNSFSMALDISQDGQTIVGTSSVPGGSRGFKWTAQTGMVELGALMSSPRGVSSDGSAIVGIGHLDDQGAVRWTEEEGVVWLGHLPGLQGRRASFASDISDDGMVIVGGSGGDYDFRAFRWTAASGMRSVEVMLGQLGVDLSGWKLGSADSVSADGSVIVGSGVNPDGNTEGWVAFIPANYVPEPGTNVFLIIGAAVSIHWWRPCQLFSSGCP